jgi:hypothetical protein
MPGVSHVRIAILAVIFALAGLLISCDRGGSASGPMAPAPPVYEVQLKPLTPLAENLPTHVVVDSLGNICWTQETERRDDTLFIMGEGLIPRTTPLTSMKIAEVLGEPAGMGNIQSVAAARGGEIYFYFQGSRGRRFLACLGIFSPKTALVRVLANTESLMSASGMGRSLGLARGTIVSNSGNLWLWLRHTDSSVLFRIPHANIPTGNLPLSLDSMVVNVIRNGKRIDMTDEEHAIAPGDGDNLLWLDVPGRELRKIAPTGEVADLQSLVGLPLALSAPSIDAASGRMTIFAGDSPKLEAEAAEQVQEPANEIKLKIRYPAMLLLDPAASASSKAKLTGVGSEDFSVYAGFDLSRMRVKQLAAEGRNPAWIAYDSNSGELLRITLVQKAAGG